MISSPISSPIRGAQRAILGQGAGGAASSFDRYVDSVSGNDANAGTSEALAYQNLSALTLVDNGRYGLALASTWREQLTVDHPITIGTFGTGAPPILDGASPVSGTWTQPDSVTYPNVWSISITKDSSATTSELLGYWEDGVRPRIATNNTTDLQNNGGWIATSRTAQTTTIYIKAAANPNSDGIVREFSKRSLGFQGHTASLSGQSPSSTIVGPIELKRYYGHYNAVSGGRGVQKQLLVRDGTIHHMVSEAEDVQDVIACEFQLGFGQAQVPLTAYRADGAGFSPVWKRAMIFGPGYATGDGVTGLLSHGSSAAPDLLTLEQCAAKDCQTGFSTDTTAYTANGLFTDGCAMGTTIQAATTAVRYSMARDPKTTGNGHYIDIGPGTGVSKTRVIENCVFYSSGAPPPLIRVNNKFGSLIVRNCIFVLNSPSATGVPLTAAASGGTLDVTFEYNVIVRIYAGGVQNTCIYTGTPNVTSDHNLWLGYSVVDCSYDGTNYRSLANWQATGRDLNSKYNEVSSSYATIKTNYFQGAPENGDFRLKAGLGTFADGVSLNLAGPQYHWDWNTRAVVAGAPEAWPTLPASVAEYRTYIADPTAWDFYP